MSDPSDVFASRKYNIYPHASRSGEPEVLLHYVKELEEKTDYLLQSISELRARMNYLADHNAELESLLENASADYNLDIERDEPE